MIKQTRYPFTLLQAYSPPYGWAGIGFLSLLLMSCLVPAAQGKPLRLSAEFSGAFLSNEAFVKDLEAAVDKYGIEEISAGGRVAAWITYSDFPKVRQAVDLERLAAFRKQLQRLKRKGLTITLTGAEPNFPTNLFNAYPEARNVNNGIFWKMIAKKTEEFFRQVPEADRYQMYLWEDHQLTGDIHNFTELNWGEDVLRAFPYYSPADYITELLAAYSRGAQAAGKEFMFLTFSHYPYQERTIIEALHQLDRSVPIILDHKSQPGDWDPYRMSHNVMQQVPDRRAKMLYDGAGEYWGQSLMPYCYPDEIQQRLQYALKCNPNIESVGMRVTYTTTALFGTFNEVNFYALAKLAKDPDMPIEDIWTGWADDRFGKEAAPKVISALKRSNDILNRVYYIKGAWVHNHSAISDLGYLESHLVNYAKAMMRWYPSDFRNNALLAELVDHTREHTIEWVLADRLEALRLNRLSLEDVESVRAKLPPGEYEKLMRQFKLQQRFIEVSLPHMEAFLRYRIERQHPSAENRRKLDQALASLEQQAALVESEYGETVPILKASAIRSYIQEVRQAVPAKAKETP